MTKTITIIVLIIVIALLLLFVLDPKGIVSKQLEKYLPDEQVEQVHQDSILIARADIIMIKRREGELIAKGKEDSVRYAKREKIFNKKIAGYENKLKAINFDVVTSDELDSIRNIVYPPGDSAYIVLGPDPLYAMPISQARDAMEAKAREPFYDSINTVQATEIDSLKEQNVDQKEACQDQLDQAHAAEDQQAVIARNLQAIIDDNAKKEKRRKPWRVVKDVLIAAVAFFAGKA
jgi:hypothetical protein